MEHQTIGLVILGLLITVLVVMMIYGKELKAKSLLGKYFILVFLCLIFGAYLSMKLLLFPNYPESGEFFCFLVVIAAFFITQTIPFFLIHKD